MSTLADYINVKKTNDPALIAELRVECSTHSNLYYNAPDGWELPAWRAFIASEDF
jgi:hypothetical protein